MATLNRSGQRRVVRKNVSTISIPRVCSLIAAPGQTLPLRLSSNLLYGLSLIYKQKVGYMAADMSSIFSRLSAPEFGSSGAALQLAANPPPARTVYLVDDAKFDMEKDFADWHETNDEVAWRKLLIKQHDNFLNNVASENTLPFAEAVDAHDALFQNFMDRTMQSLHYPLDDRLEVDFEFDKNGDIVSLQHLVDDAPPALDGIDLGETFYAATSTTVEDLSKSGNSITNDPHFEATLVQKKAVVVGHKRRKVRLHIDAVTTLDQTQVQTDETQAPPLLPQEKGLSVTRLFVEICRKQPPMLNLIYRDMFRAALIDVPSSNFPLARRRGSAILDNWAEVEQGRDFQSRRTSLSVGDRLPWELDMANFPMDAGDVDFRLQSLSPMVDVLFEEEESDTHIDVLRRLTQFKEFLASRALLISEQSPAKVREWSTGNEPHSAYTFGALIPSTDSDEAPVVRSLAAQSFASMLELSTRGYLEISTDVVGELASPDHVYVLMESSATNRRQIQRSY